MRIRITGSASITNIDVEIEVDDELNPSQLSIIAEEIVLEQIAPYSNYEILKQEE